MPNWCQNEVYIKGDAEELKELLATASKPTEKEPNPVFLMDNLVPTPKELLEGEGWYHWRLENWGTKWDLEQGLDYGETRLIDQSDTTFEMDYSTAWGPNRIFWLTVSKQFPSLVIDLRYVEESMDFMGREVIQNGEYLVEDYYNEIPTEVYKKTGAILDDEGLVDWDIDQHYNLFDFFPDFTEELV
jgi:hypothetical protein